MSGHFPNDTINFGAYTLMNSTVTYPPSSSYFDAYLVKYNSKGQLQWARQTISLDTSRNHFDLTPYAVSVDDFGNSYSSVNLTDTLIAGAYTVVSKRGLGSAAVVKYDSNGNVKWVRTSQNCVHTDTDEAAVSWVSCDHKGNVYLLGVGAYDTITFGGYKLYYNHNDYFNDFLVKYDSSGNVKWAKQAVPLSTNSSSVSYGVTTDDFGNIYTTGGVGDSVKYGPYFLSAGDEVGFVIVKWDSAGNVLWAKSSYSLNQLTGGAGQSIVADKTGSVYACGNFDGAFILGQDTLHSGVNNGVGNFFAVKYDPNGNLIWLKQASILDANYSWGAWSITIDGNHHLYLAGGGGTDTCKFVFGGDTLSYNDTAKCFALLLLRQEAILVTTQ